MFFNSCRCYYDNRLGVLCAAKITTSVSVCACCVCMWRTCLYECVCECVFLAVSELFLLITIVYIILCFSLSTKSTSGSRYHTLSGISHTIR